MRRSIWLLAAMTMLTLPAQAHAAFPGQNGRIAFHSNQDGDNEIYSINPDGTGLLKLTDNTADDRQPSWSPDGQEIVFTRFTGDPFGGDIWKMNADGSGQALVTSYYSNTPSWTTNDQQIAFTVDAHCDGPPFFSGGVHTVNADGSNLTWLTCGFDDGACCTSWSPDGTRVVWSEAPGPPPAIYVHTIGGGTVRLTPFDDGCGRGNPDWSPNAQKIIFTFSEDICGSGNPDQLYTMNPDGSGQAPLRQGSGAVWSPDGKEIAFNGIFTANADGSGGTFVVGGSSPSWQPLPINSYPRPKGATPTRFSLLPGYAPCTSANRQHGPPLAFPSCNPPAPSSPHLTVGTPEANGAQVQFFGHLLMRALAGSPGTPDEADATLEISTNDVRCSLDSPPATCGAPNTTVNGSFPSTDDYTGELQGIVFLQITDKDNTPHPGGPGAATVQEFDLRFDVPCAETPTVTTHGASCSTSTTVDALLPGAVKEGKRAIWQLDRVQVRDGGPDGDAATPGNRVFLRPGVFIP